MRVLRTIFDDAKQIACEPVVDRRGFFKETFRINRFAEFGIHTEFVQDNVLRSTKGVLRGLHYDLNMTKYVQVVYGQTFHVSADLRPHSPTYCLWQAFTLSDENHVGVYVPAGFGNGFYVLSDIALVYYKQSAYFNAASERQVRWNDPALAIEWPYDSPILSDKDRDVPDYRRGPTVISQS